MTKLLLAFLLSMALAPAKRYHAFEVYAGKGFVALDGLKYAGCDYDISFSPHSFSLNREYYSIDYTEKLGDSLLTYFGHRMIRGESVPCSFIAMAPEGSSKPWTLLFTWSDSLKAFHANVVEK